MRTLTAQELTAVSGAAIVAPTLTTNNTGITITFHPSTGDVSTTITWTQLVTGLIKLIKSF
ncbi:MAG: hypothetical protein V4532_01570 [Pseudomonadota bacterium]